MYTLSGGMTTVLIPHVVSISAAAAQPLSACQRDKIQIMLILHKHVRMRANTIKANGSGSYIFLSIQEEMKRVI